MRKVIYSERRRRIHAFFKNLYKKSMFYQWSKKSHGIDASNVDPLTGLYNPFGINTFLKELHPQAGLNYAIILLNIDSVHDKFHRTLILSGICLLKIARISLNSSFFPKPIKR